MTTDELITNASPEQLREALRRVVAIPELLESSGVLATDFFPKSYGYNSALAEVKDLINNALEGKE